MSTPGDEIAAAFPDDVVWDEIPIEERPTRVVYTDMLEGDPEALKEMKRRGYGS